MPQKDETGAHPVPQAWRSAIVEIVGSFVREDYSPQCAGEVVVLPVDSRTRAIIEYAVSGYGETLTSLPAETWDSSVCQWMWDYWDLVVDLWTVESGRSDLVLELRVYESGDRYIIEVASVRVP